MTFAKKAFQPCPHLLLIVSQVGFQRSSIMVFAVVVVTVFATAFVVLVVVGGFVTVFVFVFIEAAVAAVEEI